MVQWACVWVGWEGGGAVGWGAVGLSACARGIRANGGGEGGGQTYRGQLVILPQQCLAFVSLGVEVEHRVVLAELGQLCDGVVILHEQELQPGHHVGVLLLGMGCGGLGGRGLGMCVQGAQDREQGKGFTQW